MNGRAFELNFMNSPLGVDLFNAFAEEGSPPSPPTIDVLIQQVNNNFILTQAGDRIVIQRL